MPDQPPKIDLRWMPKAVGVGCAGMLLGFGLCLTGFGPRAGATAVIGSYLFVACLIALLALGVFRLIIAIIGR